MKEGRHTHTLHNCRDFGPWNHPRRKLRNGSIGERLQGPGPYIPSTSPFEAWKAASGPRSNLNKVHKSLLRLDNEVAEILSILE